jgi:hypothetical protein
MDLTKWFADLIAAGVGGLIGGSVGAYFKGYSEEKGRHLATYEDIVSLLAQERGKAYEQETGKRLATHDDIENVLKEVRIVTRETETIKAQVSADTWNRQTVWNQRRDLYGEIFQAIADYRKLMSIDPVNEAWKEEYRSILGCLKRLLALSHIFLGKDGRTAFSTFFEKLVEPAAFDDGRGDVLEAIQTFEITLIRAARRDLGVNLE